MTNPYGISAPTTIPADLLAAFNAGTQTAVAANRVQHRRERMYELNMGTLREDES